MRPCISFGSHRFYQEDGSLCVYATFAALFAALLLAMPAAAQEQTGSIVGVIKDASGAVLPGATVEARSPSSIGVRSTTTDEQGAYRFPALPAGTYEVSATLQGFTPAKVGEVRVELGKQFTVDLTLKLAGVAESVTVSAESPLIDVKASATTASIDAQYIDLIPKGRGLLSVLTQIPGTNNEVTRRRSDDRRRLRLGEPLPRRRRRSHQRAHRLGDRHQRHRDRGAGLHRHRPGQAVGLQRGIPRGARRRRQRRHQERQQLVPRHRGCLPDRQQVAGRHPPDASRDCRATRRRAEYITTPATSATRPTWWPRSAARSSGTRAGSSSATRRSSTRRSGPSRWANPLTFPATQTFDNGDPNNKVINYNVDLAAGQLAPRAFHRQQRDAEGGPRPSEHPAGRHQHGERRDLQPAQHRCSPSRSRMPTAAHSTGRSARRRS